MGNLAEFKSGFKALYRPNQFKVTLEFPTFLPAGISPSAASRATEFFVRSAEIPGSSIGSVAVPYRGRMVKYAGDRTFTPWTVTVMNDDGFLIRKAIEAWMSKMDNHSTGCTDADGIQPKLYQKTMKVEQLSRTCAAGGETAIPGTPNSGDLVWLFKNAFPIELSPIQLDYQSNDVIEEYTVTFDYDYWLSESGTTL